MSVSPSGGSNVIGEVIGGRDLRISPPEHSFTFHCDQAHYGPVSRGGEASGVTGGQAVFGSGCLVLVRDVDGAFRGIMDRRGGYGQASDGYGLIIWEDTAANLILGSDHNAPLAYAPVLELHHPIMSMIWGHGGRLDI